MVVCIVTKRHHTRFFPDAGGASDRSGNVPPGFVTDGGICDPNQFEFYLQSHAGIQGTSRPTKYTVVHDEVGVTADEFQMLTYHLCYLLCRCTRSVSQPPPSFYAHIVAFRAKTLKHGADMSSSGVGKCFQEHHLLQGSMYFV